MLRMTGGPVFRRVLIRIGNEVGSGSGQCSIRSIDGSGYRPVDSADSVAVEAGVDAVVDVGADDVVEGAAGVLTTSSDCQLVPILLTSTVVPSGWYTVRMSSVGAQARVEPDCTVSVNSVVPEDVSVRVRVVPEIDAVTFDDGDVVPEAAAVTVEVTVESDAVESAAEESAAVESVVGESVVGEMDEERAVLPAVAGDADGVVDVGLVDPDAAPAMVDGAELDEAESAAAVLEVDEFAAALSAKLCTPADTVGHV